MSGARLPLSLVRRLQIIRLYTDEQHFSLTSINNSAHLLLDVVYFLLKLEDGDAFSVVQTN